MYINIDPKRIYHKIPLEVNDSYIILCRDQSQRSHALNNKDIGSFNFQCSKYTCKNPIHLQRNCETYRTLKKWNKLICQYEKAMRNFTIFSEYDTCMYILYMYYHVCCHIHAWIAIAMIRDTAGMFCPDESWKTLNIHNVCTTTLVQH